MKKIKIIGAGLAGVEAAFYLLKKGVEVELYEMRPNKMTEAHHSGYFAELVCSNSLKSNRLDNACGLLKEELRHLGSICLDIANQTAVPGGESLNVDRASFCEKITAKITSFPNFHLVNQEVTTLDDDAIYILATGPLTSETMSQYLANVIGSPNLYFYDASSPIVTKDSIDFSVAYFKSRYDKGEASYINCPFSKEEYELFVRELINAKCTMLHDFDKNYFFGCMPIEVMAKKGFDSLRYGPLKPKGLEHDGLRPYAVVQLRQDNAVASLYNLVGFQTNLTYSEQKRVFRLIPALSKAEFVRYGLMHRNTFLNGPFVLDEFSRLKNKPNIFIAGQLSGVEGYVESMMSGLISGINAYRMANGLALLMPPLVTMSGALLNYITHATSQRFTPMNANYGILLNENRFNKEQLAEQSLKAIDEYLEELENDKRVK